MKTLKQLAMSATIAASMFSAGNALAAGATDTSKSVTLNVTFPPKASLSLTGTTITFDATAVDNGTAISGGTTNVTAKVRTGATENPTLTVQADNDFINATYAGANIPASDVTWTGSGNLAAGTLSKAAQTHIENGWAGSNTYTGDMTWSLANNSNYSTGTYSSITVNYTLTAP